MWLIEENSNKSSDEEQDRITEEQHSQISLQVNKTKNKQTNKKQQIINKKNPAKSNVGATPSATTTQKGKTGLGSLIIDFKLQTTQNKNSTF